VDLFNDRPDTDVEDVETVLLQVMLDEFEVNVDDDSGFEVAEQIMEFRKDCLDGKFAGVEKLRERWVKKGGKGEIATSGFTRVERGEDDDEETDWSSGDEDEDMDMDMDEAPQLVEKKEKPAPEVDEDGFTTVVSKKKR
jgi:pre-rRNA-processing protein TSR2